MLIQEASKATLRTLTEKKNSGLISNEEYVELRGLLKSSTRSIKSEFRRTLLKHKDGPACASRNAELSTKAIQCIASLYPFSSDGLLLSYRENKLLDGVGKSESVSHMSFHSDSAQQNSRHVNILSPVDTSGKKGKFLSTTIASPHVRRDSSPYSVFASPLLAPLSDPRFPTHVVGTLLKEDLRNLEKKFVVCTRTHFVSRSLSSTNFIAIRRAALAEENLRRRLAGKSTAEPTVCNNSMASLSRVCSTSSQGISEVFTPHTAAPYSTPQPNRQTNAQMMQKRYPLSYTPRCTKQPSHEEAAKLKSLW
ncbi:hypothetical protein, conserved [Angomonas deanei]|uniref:Uncharacterized protein n=1 Tax=Angomonas deanei TaxID=59799 RepID=A0A7G2CKH0_9TRYP|nr:hypothetical protein, conserved [Angomonas deanei]